MNTHEEISKAILDAIDNVDHQMTKHAIVGATRCATSKSTVDTIRSAIDNAIDNANYVIIRDATNYIISDAINNATWEATFTAIEDMAEDMSKQK